MEENKNEITNEERNESLMKQPEQLEQSERAENPVDEPTVDSKVEINTLLPNVAPKMGGGKKGLIISGSIALIVISTVLLFCMALGMFNTKTPFDRTMEAIFPEIALLEDIGTRGGSVSIDANIGSDLSDRVQDQPVWIHADFVLGNNGMTLSGALGSEEEQLDVGLLVDDEGIQIYSDRLLDGGYSIAFEGLIEGINKSIFAPDSGTDYALPQEVYDMICEYVESLNDPEDNPYEYEAIEAVLENMLISAMEYATIEEQDMTLALLSGDATATLHIITFDAQAVIAATDVLLDAWKNDAAFYEELSSIFKFYYEDELNDMESTMDIHEWMDMMYGELETKIHILTEGMQEDNALIRLMYGVKSGYLVYMEMTFEVDMTVDTKGKKERSITTLRLTMTEQPKKDPAYDMVLVSRLGAESTQLFSMSYRKQENRFTLVITVIDTATESGDTVLTLQGSQLFDRNYAAITIDGIQYKSGDTVLFEMSESTFTFEFKSGRQTVSRKDGDIDLLSMSVEDMDALGEELEKKLDEFYENVNASLEFDLFYETLAVRTQSTLIIDDTMYDYAYDRKTGHLFMATVDGKGYYIVMYDVQTMEQLRKMQVRGKVVAMDADNGYLVYHLSTDSDFTINVNSAENLQKIKTINLKGQSGVMDYHLQCSDMLIDGNVVIGLGGDHHRYLLFVNINTEEVFSISQNHTEATLAIDRESHVLGVNETSSSNCTFAMYHSTSGRLIREGNKEDRYNRDPVYFDGVSFQSYGYHFMIDGTESSTAKLITDRKLEDREAEFLALVYKDSNILVTLEQSVTGTYYTMFYMLTGKSMGAPVFEKIPNEVFTRIEKVGDHSYIAILTFIGTGAYYTSIEYFTIEPTVDIGF